MRTHLRKKRDLVYSRPVETIKDGSIEAGLLLLRCWRVKHPNVPLTARQIAFVCGCSQQRIQQIEARALKALRRYRMEIFT